MLIRALIWLACCCSSGIAATSEMNVDALVAKVHVLIRALEHEFTLEQADASFLDRFFDAAESNRILLDHLDQHGSDDEDADSGSSALRPPSTLKTLVAPTQAVTTQPSSSSSSAAAAASSPSHQHLRNDDGNDRCIPLSPGEPIIIPKISLDSALFDTPFDLRSQRQQQASNSPPIPQDAETDDDNDVYQSTYSNDRGDD